MNKPATTPLTLALRTVQTYPSRLKCRLHFSKLCIQDARQHQCPARFHAGNQPFRIGNQQIIKEVCTHHIVFHPDVQRETSHIPYLELQPIRHSIFHCIPVSHAHSFGIIIKRLDRRYSTAAIERIPDPSLHPTHSPCPPSAGPPIGAGKTWGGVLACPEAQSRIEDHHFRPGLAFSLRQLGFSSSFLDVDRFKMPFPGIYPVLPPQTFDLQLPGSDCQTALGHGLQSRLYGVPVRFGNRLFLTR